MITHDDGVIVGLGGFGYYPGRWIHVDTRPRKADGTYAQWIGQGIGSEKTG